MLPPNQSPTSPQFVLFCRFAQHVGSEKLISRWLVSRNNLNGIDKNDLVTDIYGCW